jgi:hypothetical protein
MGIFLPAGAAFVLELEGGEEFDPAGFEEVASGLRHLTVAVRGPVASRDTLFGR